MDFNPLAQTDFESIHDSKNAFGFLAYLENEYNCSGICSPSLFSLSTPFSYPEAMPTCNNEIKTEFTFFAARLQQLVAVTAITMLVTVAVSFSLYLPEKTHTKVRVQDEAEEESIQMIKQEKVGSTD